MTTSETAWLYDGVDGVDDETGATKAEDETTLELTVTPDSVMTGDSQAGAGV
jgi:hypothetical protein